MPSQTSIVQLIIPFTKVHEILKIQYLPTIGGPWLPGTCVGECVGWLKYVVGETGGLGYGQ